MSNFAVLDGQDIINVIVADSKEAAELVTGKTCIEYTTEPAEPGGTYDGTSFIKRKPFNGWVLNSNKEWEPPTPQPKNTENGYYVWDDNSMSWVEIIADIITE